MPASGAFGEEYNERAVLHPSSRLVCRADAVSVRSSVSVEIPDVLLLPSRQKNRTLVDLSLTYTSLNEDIWGSVRGLLHVKHSTIRARYATIRHKCLARRRCENT